MDSFPIQVKDLTNMMQSQLKAYEQLELLSKHGGVEGLCRKLKTNSTTGLDPGNQADLEARRSWFGRNEIPSTPPKSILMLMWDALHDTTLIILLICAITSLGVSFYPDASSLPDEEEYSKEIIRVKSSWLTEEKYFWQN